MSLDLATLSADMLADLSGGDRRSRIAAAEETFGSAERAAAWLRRPNDLLNGEAPVALLGSDEGMSAVDTLLGCIAHGLAA